MTREEIVSNLKRTAPALKAEGVTGLAIFGSRARGDARTDSDLDVLLDVDPDSRFSLLDLAGVHLMIEDRIGIPTQVTLRRALDPRMADRIKDDLIKVF